MESYFEERARETWERNLRKTTLLTVCNPTLMETIQTGGEIAGLVPETSREREPILKERGGFW